jgi:hypothetical protein
MNHNLYTTFYAVSPAHKSRWFTSHSSILFVESTVHGQGKGGKGTEKKDGVGYEKSAVQSKGGE